MRRFTLPIGLILALFFVALLAAPVSSAQYKETDILTWSGSAWVRITKGQLYTMVGGANAAYAQSATSGVGFTVSRDLASGSTNNPLCYILNDNTGDDQLACKIRDDGTGGALGLYDGATLRWSLGDGGAQLLTTAATTSYASKIDASTVTSGDGLLIQVVDGTLNGGYYLRCYDGTNGDFTVGEGGVVYIGGTSTLHGNAIADGTLTSTGAFTASSTVNIGGASTLATTNWGAGGASTGATLTSTNGNFATAGSVTAAGAVSGLRPVSAAISGTSATLTVASYPSGSFIDITAATTAITLPAVTSGCTYTFHWKGGTATSLTLTAPSACLAIDGQTALKTSAVWTTTGLFLCVTVVADSNSWIITSMTTLPDSAS